MDDCKRKVLLEKIIYKMSRQIVLDGYEKKIVDEIVEIKDYGRILK